MERRIGEEDNFNLISNASAVPYYLTFHPRIEKPQLIAC